MITELENNSGTSIGIQKQNEVYFTTGEEQGFE